MIIDEQLEQLVKLAEEFGYKKAQHELDRLKAENARLREALESIATLGNIFEEKASAQVAREALKGGE